MRRRIAEIDQHAVAELARDKAAKSLHFRRDLTVIGGNHLPQILRVEPR